MKQEKIREFFKSMTLGVLLVALVCLCVIYIVSFSGAKAYAFTKQDMERISKGSLRTEYLSHWDVSFASPAFMGFSSKQNGENIGFYTLGGENAEVYETVFPFFEKLFGIEGYIEAMPSQDGETLFHALLKGDYIYLSYACDLPVSVIVSMTDESAVYEGTSDVYIRELLIVPKDYLRKTALYGEENRLAIYSFYALARDSRGNYYRCSTDFIPADDGDVSFHTNYYLTYTKAENRVPYEFAHVWKADGFFSENGFSEKVTDTSVIPLTFMASPMIFSEPHTLEKKEMHTLLEIFSLNPEKASSYKHENGNVFYFDEGKHLCFQPDGIMIYNLYETEPLPLEEIFPWGLAKEDYGTADYLVASFLMLEALTGAHGETDCDFYLSGIYYDGEILRISFGSSACGLPVSFEGQTDMLTFEFSAGKLQSAKYCFRAVRKTEDTRPAQDFIWTLRTLILKNEECRRYFYGYYVSDKQSYFDVLVLEEIRD
ncbi:MAG: hypothetical protein E7603_03185 [Ruminococcaceae bacterium]|nr:hypothetical protein [Oscillospiraceae bacterium]